MKKVSGLRVSRSARVSFHVAFAWSSRLLAGRRLGRRNGRTWLPASSLVDGRYWFLIRVTHARIEREWAKKEATVERGRKENQIDFCCGRHKKQATIDDGKSEEATRFWPPSKRPIADARRVPTTTGDEGQKITDQFKSMTFAHINRFKFAPSSSSNDTAPFAVNHQLTLPLFHSNKFIWFQK